ncbi:putative Endonuclease-reverse transcriptase [Trypanosoma cruzi]|uniref:Putative Endonuclease-reverse transcriptase n=1 Tax=Trypanosoma cruzi TaxID=5693 RepID=A0A2V2VK07_TRYCR|nr:putative Endonuclease-reverse transcriptase [Trypanosoma cruzi]
MAARGAVLYPLLNSVGACQRYTYRLRAVCDAQRQKLLLSGDIEQNPGPIAALQMNVSCLTPSKLATLMAQGADIIAIQETWKSSEQIASMHTGDYVLYAQSRIGKGGGVAVLVRKTLRSKRIPLAIPQHDTSLEVVVVQAALDQNRDLIVASAYMRPPPQVTQSFQAVSKLPSSLVAAPAVWGFQHASPTVGAILGDFSKRGCCRIFRTVHGCGTHLG